MLLCVTVCFTVCLEGRESIVTNLRQHRLYGIYGKRGLSELNPPDTSDGAWERKERRGKDVLIPLGKRLSWKIKKPIGEGWGNREQNEDTDLGNRHTDRVHIDQKQRDNLAQWNTRARVRSSTEPYMYVIDVHTYMTGREREKERGGESEREKNSKDRIEIEMKIKCQNKYKSEYGRVEMSPDLLAVVGGGSLAVWSSRVFTHPNLLSAYNRFCTNWGTPSRDFF